MDRSSERSKDGWRRGLRRLRQHLWRTAQDDRDLDDEVAFHLACEAELRADRGMDTPAAHAAARRDFGHIGQVKEVTRDMAGRHVLDTLARDLTFGLRLLRRSRGFAFFTIASLALGIGATSAIFSLFDAIVLRPMPVGDPNRLVVLAFAAGGSRPNNYLTYPLFDRLRSANTTLESLFAWTGSGARRSLRIDGRLEIVSAAFVSGAYHRTLRLQPALGRLLSDEDDQPNTATSIVISYGHWQRRFGGDPSVIGKQITANDVTYTIVGVEPRGFVGANVGAAPDVTFPLRASTHGTTGPGPWNAANATWIEVIGRLKPGVTPEQSAHELTAIFRNMPAGIPAPPTAPPPTIFVEAGRGGGQSVIRNAYQQRLRVMLTMMTAVLLLASLNVATLLLARAEARRDEITMRLALGASRWRVIRQLLTESAILATAGGTLGLLLAWWASQALLTVAIRDTVGIGIDVTPDARVLTFTLAASAITCLVFGLLPAVRSTAQTASVRREVRGRRQRWLERTLVASQTAVSLVLLVFMALFLRSLDNLWARDPGYVRENVGLFSTDARLAGKKRDDFPATYRAVLDALRATPAVTHAAIATVAPISTTYYFVNGAARLGDKNFPGDQRIRVATNYLSPGYFDTLGIPLTAGRDFDFRDGPTAPKVVIISERLAAKFEGPALGQTVEWSGGTAEVIGIARDTRYARIQTAPRDVIYSPMFQHLAGSMSYGPTFITRYQGDIAPVFQSIRDAVARVDPALTLFNLNTLEAYTRESLSAERLMAATSTYVGGFALLLAAIGLYGLMTYSITERTAEIGLRMALGSSPGQVRTMVLRNGAATVLVGIVAGVGAALWLVGFAREQIVDVKPIDPVSFAVAAVVLLAVASAAAWLPALRASRIDPITALRHE
jgi:predicted permease